MYLKQIELQGFKTFAKKTTLSFLPPTKDTFPLTAIVGPNGSGKSNLSDAIRWTLGEQSLKMLRGKDSTDVIFSGSEGKGRAGFAEVTMTFDNSTHVFPIDTVEVSVTRRLYRDGESEYQINGAKTRLQDLQLMLAEAGVGQRSYSVIGQGMVDAILTSSPQERKTFFDDATGVRPLQIKRHQAMLKLRRTYENLAETEMVLKEIEPRLRLLARQTRRLEERADVEATLSSLQTRYYQSLWFALEDDVTEVKRAFGEADVRVAEARTAMETLETEVAALEEAERANHTDDPERTRLQQALRQADQNKRAARDEEFRLQKEIELSRVRTQANWSPLPLKDLLTELEQIVAQQDTALATLKTLKSLDELNALLPNVETTFGRAKTLAKKLKRPEEDDVRIDPKLEADLAAARSRVAELDAELKTLDQALERVNASERTKRGDVFAIERTLRERQRELHQLEQARSAKQIDLARLEERQSNLRRDCEFALKDAATALLAHRPETLERLTPDLAEQQRAEIEKLKYKLELIGAIDPEIVAEYEETQQRFSFLEEQLADLRSAMKDTEKLIDTLDERIHAQSEKAFRAINKEFQTYFKVLFGGGSCSLVKMTQDEASEEHDEAAAHEGDVNETLEAVDPNALSELKKRVEERGDRVVGIEIQATPPGKKLKSLNLLSGGERALTSIALLAAIMATNPAPFVVLDEVDAALDEANTMRFASILDQLRKNTQYIVVTHNRATMEKADVLYGVTMNDDGISQLLSVNMEELGEGTARR